jgi:signal transduction histidine kinase
LEQEIVRVSETEQRRIGQDLHDGLCQHLAAIGFAAKSLADDLEKCERPETAAAQEIESLLKQAVIEARDLARGMFPVQMDGAGLSAALEGLASTTSRLTSTEVVFTEKGQVQISDTAVAMHLYRIAQESVANAIKHAAARHIFITLESEAEKVRLRIDDDGKGFFEQEDMVKGMGMRTMAYRARLIGGTLEIQERDGPGTCVWCELRLPVSSPVRHET